MIGLKLNEEESFHGEIIETLEEFIEDLCERVNTVYSSEMDEDEKMIQLSYLIGLITTLKGRLNRVCENI